jgi:hypothetical protein
MLAMMLVSIFFVYGIMSQWVRVMPCVVGIPLVILIVYMLMRLLSNPFAPTTSISTGSTSGKVYSWSTWCDEKLSIYYDQFLLCLQSIPNPELLRVDYAEPSNEISKCNNQLNRDSLLGWCFYQSDYRFIHSICRTIHEFQENEVLYQLKLVPCIQYYDYLIWSWSGIIETRKQLDWSSFVACSGNYDCLSDEFCSIQWVQRCEKILGVYSDGAKLLNVEQMDAVIKDKSNKIKSWWDSHSHVNSLVLDNGQIYVIIDVSVLWLIDKYYSDREKSMMELWIE